MDTHPTYLRKEREGEGVKMRGGCFDSITSDLIAFEVLFVIQNAN